MHRDPETVFLNGKKFYLAHGDGLGPGDHGYKFLKKVFENRINQWLFRQIHPDLAFRLAYFWSGQSRYANAEKERRGKRIRAARKHRLALQRAPAPPCIRDIEKRPRHRLLCIRTLASAAAIATDSALYLF